MWDIVLAVICLVVGWWIYSTRRPAGAPPGPPIPIPFLGDVYLLSGDNIYNGYRNLRKKYGDIFSLRLCGAQDVVFVADSEIIKEILGNDDFIDLPSNDLEAEIRGGKSLGISPPGVTMSTGQTWREQRRFVLATLKDYGMGKKDKLQEMITEEITVLLDKIEADSKGGTVPINPRYIFNVTTMNSLWRMVTGEVIPPDDPRPVELLKLIDRSIADLGTFSGNAVYEYPLVDFISEGLGFTKIRSGFEEVLIYTYELIDKHRKRRAESNEDEAPVDFISAYDKYRKTAAPGTSFYQFEGELNLAAVVLDLFFGGGETTGSTLNWTMLYLALNPDVQEKVHKELDEQIGRNKLPELNDKEKTPYLEATIHEVQRLGSLLPVVMRQNVNKFSKVGPYTVPPKKEVGALMVELNRDPKIFPNPDKMDPSRYIDENGKFVPHPMVMPFGWGRRRCLGELIARANLYMIIAALLQKFRVEKKSPDDNPSLEPEAGFVLKPPPFEVKFIPRF